LVGSYEKGASRAFASSLGFTQTSGFSLARRFEETTSLGVRTYEVERFELSRRIQKVSTPYGVIDVKIGCDSKGRVLNTAPEYESCKRLAKEKKIPLKMVYAAALKSLKS